MLGPIAVATPLLLAGSAIAGRLSDINAAHSNRVNAVLETVGTTAVAAANSTAGYRFYNNQTAQYHIESLPDFNFDLGEIYSGLIPIQQNNDTRELFFIFQPKLNSPSDQLTIWFNGGPGCSSLEGFLQENGRWQWQPGTYAPTEQEYSWPNLTNMLWVEQPVGTGFSIGEVVATSQEDIVRDFISWFKNFQTTFGIKNFEIFVTGESYAGRYVPYVSNGMLDQNDTEYYNLKGSLMYDPCIGEFVSIQEEYTAVPLAVQSNAVLGFNDSFIAELETLHKQCGYADYLDKYLTFPASGVQPALYFNFSDPETLQCDLLDLINDAAWELNPCFDIYEINEQCPLLWDVLSFPTELVYTAPGATTYFNRSDVKAALHAPASVDWAECSVEPVFLGNGGPQGEGDLSPDPIQHVLPRVIEATNRVLVANGDLDMVIITNGTLLAIQNMTWNGKLGFETRPSTPININLTDPYASVFAENGAAGYDEPQGDIGVQHYERGLMWAETHLSGHMQPEFQPRAAYRHLQWLLGEIETL